MKKHIVFIFVVFLPLITGCAGTGGFGSWPSAPTNEPKPQYSKIERWKSQPTILKTQLADGTVAVQEIAYAEEREYAVNATPGQSEQRGFFGWLFSSSGLWMWIVLAFILFVPGGWGIFTWALGRVRGRLGKAVKGVEDFLQSDAPEEIKKKLLDSIRGRVGDDKKTKSEIDNLKRS